MPHSVFRCTDCGAEQPKWGGRCEACGAWNTLVEELVGRNVGKLERGKGLPSNVPPVRLSEVAGSRVARWRTGLPEFDFVLGGGIVPGDRKSTRLNSSHLVISYAVFCLKKKTYSTGRST